MTPWGTPEGDNILKQVADSIKSCFRQDTDIIGRIGGDEFLIFLSDINDDRVLEMAQSLSSSIINLKVKAASEYNPCDFLSISMTRCGMLNLLRQKSRYKNCGAKTLSL